MLSPKLINEHIHKNICRCGFREIIARIQPSQLYKVNYTSIEHSQSTLFFNFLFVLYLKFLINFLQ